MRAWTRNRRVAELTGEIIDLHERVAKTVVDGAIEIGRRLIEIRATLAHGTWESWLAQAVPFTPTTASNYIALTQWAEQRPTDIEKLRHLGAAKLYLLARLLPRQRRTVTARRPLPIRSGGKKTIKLMTVPELRDVIQDRFKAPSPGPAKPPIRRVIASVRKTVARLDDDTEAFLRRKSEVQPEVAVEIRDALWAMAEEIETAFGL